MYKFSKRSLKNLEGVHPKLVEVAYRALELTDVDFGVIEGLRTYERQKELKARGASKTLNSRHITGHAIDVMAYVGSEGRWDWGLYLKIAEAFRQASLDLQIPIRWGGTWDLLSKLQGPIKSSQLHKRFPDGPHMELPSKVYP